MQPGFDKCAVLKMKRGKQVHCEVSDLGDVIMTEEADKEGYKYLGILDRDDIYQEKMKEKVIINELNDGNVINTINIWAVATVRYETGIINWNKGELDKIDRQTQKLLNMHRGLHSWSSVDRLYILRANGGRRVLSVKDCFELERSNLFDFSANNNKRLLKAATEELQLRTKLDGKKKIERGNERQAAWIEKVLHGQFPMEKEVALAESR